MPRLLALLLTLGVLAAAEPRPLIIAHRGASGYLPEHTLAAKALAYGQGADFLEQDVVLSKDGVPVVFHDHAHRYDDGCREEIPRPPAG